jgi:REP element-mobilizing transposase RayT
MNDKPFAIHVTWTTYGTWLPGDPRGYVSVTLRPDGTTLKKENQYGTPYTKDDAFTRRIAIDEQEFETVWLNAQQARVVAHSLVEACRERGWWIGQAAVMCNHIHVVVLECPPDGPAVRRILKGVTQSKLSKHHGSPKRWYTRGGSNRHKYDQQAIDNALNYVKRQEGMLAGIENMVVYVPGEARREEPRG